MIVQGRFAAGTLLALLALAPLSARAHELRPAYLEITEDSRRSVHVLWKQPVIEEVAVPLVPHLSSGWLDGPGEASSDAESSRILRWTVAKPDAPLAGQSVTIEGLDRTTTDVLVRVTFADGESLTRMLRPLEPSFTIERAAGGAGASSGARRTGATAYLQLGIEHILMGVDHLLFVLGLLLIVSDRWMLVKTVTAFTVAHSITLAIATLGSVSVPAQPLNAAIALSILFLGPEIVRRRRGETSLTIRHPWLVAFAFGLLHGFGFASGLTAMGLPHAEIPLALLLFNVGVELGQLGFVGVVLALERSFRTLEIRWPGIVQALPAYAVGSLGAYWTIQRTLVLLGVTR
jgi:hydrogenase/urease accessory protein HupE